MSWDVRFEGVTKSYRRDGLSQKSLRVDLANASRRLTGRRTLVHRDSFNAVEDLDIEIEQGVPTALVGRNGAGKSTALRLISRITYPTAGRVHVRGRVGALLEIGAGIHPELSGRENIWLYGSFLGIRRSEIRVRFDDIVEFAEVGAFVDTQVKHYSTGMQLRLGFAIAAFLRPQVFIVDETLAVGDAAFQARCVDRMRALASEGATVVFVSHETAAVEAICERGIWLEDGRLRDAGPLDRVLQQYHRSLQSHRAESAGGSHLRDALALDGSGRLTQTVTAGEPVTLRFDFETTDPIERPNVRVRIADTEHLDLIETALDAARVRRDPVHGRWSAECVIRSLPLAPRGYHVSCALEDDERRLVDWTEVLTLHVRAPSASPGDLANGFGPPVLIDADWTVR